MLKTSFRDGMVLQTMEKVMNYLIIPISILAIGLITYIQCHQLAGSIKYGEELSSSMVSNYGRDLISNGINIIFILRFSIVDSSYLFVEVCLALILSVLCGHSIYDFYLNFVNSIPDTLYLLQYACPIVLNILNTMEAQSVKSYLILFNDNLLPIFLSNSFVLVNLQFPLFDNSYVLFYYRIVIISLKFYCLLTYILYELFNINDVMFAKKLNFKNYLILVSIVILSIFDLVIIRECV